MDSTELTLRIAAAISVSALAAVFFVGRRDQARWWGALYCLGIVAFVLTSARTSARLPDILLYPLVLLCVTKAAWFLLFAKGLFTESFRLNLRYALLIAVIGVYGLWQQLVFVPNARIEPVTGSQLAASLGFEALVLATVVFALLDVYRGLGVDLVEGRRRLRVLFVSAAAAYLAVAAGVQVYNLLLNARTPLLLAHANLALMAIAGVLVMVSLLQMRPASWLEPSREVSPKRLSTAEAHLLRALERALEENRIYREHDLTIGRLAERLGTREHLLRRVINRGLGFRNYNDFLHAYRIREAAERLCDPAYGHLPVLSLALDIGYGSIGPFNRAFKARTGMTPTMYRRQSGRTAGPPDVHEPIDCPP